MTASSENPKRGQGSGCQSYSGGWELTRKVRREPRLGGWAGRVLCTTRVQALELSRCPQGEPRAKARRGEWTGGWCQFPVPSASPFPLVKCSPPARPLHFLPLGPQSHLHGSVHEWGGAAGKWALQGRGWDFGPSCHRLISSVSYLLGPHQSSSDSGTRRLAMAGTLWFWPLSRANTTIGGQLRRSNWCAVSHSAGHVAGAQTRERYQLPGLMGWEDVGGAPGRTPGRGGLELTPAEGLSRPWVSRQPGQASSRLETHLSHIQGH